MPQPTGAGHGLPADGIEDVCELGPLQEALLVHALCRAESAPFVRQITVPLSPAIDTTVLREAWAHVTAETPILRTGFVWEDLERPLQLVRAAVALPFIAVDLSELPDERAEVECERLADRDRTAPFDLGRAPLFRVLVVRNANGLRMIWTYHHILLDAWSVGLLLEAICSAYTAVKAGRTPARSGLRPYRDFIARVRTVGDVDALRYWRRELQDFTAPTLLSPRPVATDAWLTPCLATAEMVLPIDDAVVERVARAASRLDVTVYTLLEAAWALTLSLQSGALDVVFGTAVSGRTTVASEIESVVGLVSNVVPRRVRLDEELSVGGWMQRLQAGTASRFEHEHTALRKIRAVSALSGAAPLFLSVLVQETPAPQLPGFIQPESGSGARDHEWSGHPLTVFLATAQRFIWFVYDPLLVSEQDVREVAGAYATAIDELVVDRGDTVADLLRRVRSSRRQRRPLPAAVSPSRPGWTSSSVVDSSRAVAARLHEPELVERHLAAAWRRALAKPVGWDDNVFELGADSFTVLRVHAEAERELGCDFPLLAMFADPTIAGVARRLRGAPVSGDPRAMKPYEEIAVIGMHVNAPGASTLQEFWDIIRDGREAVSFFSADELAAAGVPAAALSDPHYVPAGAPLPDIDMFDASFFGVSPGDAATMDPQIRRFLEGSWSLLESAGYDPQRLDVPVGVYAGSAISTYLLTNLISSATHRDALERAGLLMQLNEPDALSTYVSYKLDLKGPSVAVQTMCSTSLVAVHLACHALRARECDMALAGGVSINVHQSKGYVHEEGLYFSPDGHTRPFDARAGGTLFGSGAGIVLLKRLEDAVRDGDDISAVIIGSAINNDGSGKAGFTAPSIAGQARVITEALAVAAVRAEDIDYVEAHGTATPLGDLIELEALTRVFRRQSTRRSFCCLGSAKANFGHLDKAAGVIGLIKACLAIRHREFPPMANFQSPSPRLDWSASPFYVRTNGGEWAAENRPRRAGVSSFGIGGTNAHVVLEEAPVRSPSQPARAVQLLTWSARTPTALESMTATLASMLAEEGPDLPALSEISYVMHVGRAAFTHRRMLVASSRAGALTSLRPGEFARTHRTVVPAREPEVVFLFPGGGVQFQGMARDTIAAEPVFRRHIERAHQIVESATGIDLLGLLASPETVREHGPAAIDDVLTLQVALFSVEYALAQLLLHWGIKPAALIGHSVGEYVAASVAGVMRFEDALQLLITRGTLMRGLATGGMLAVLRPEREVRSLLSDGLYLTAVNSRQQCVVSGSGPAVAALHQRLIAEGIECQPLSVGIASHSPMMQPMVDGFTAALRGVTLRAPTIPLVSGVTGTWMTDEDATSPNHWVRHLTQTVRFADAMTTVATVRPAVFLEVGPGHALANLAKDVVAPAEHDHIIPCMDRQPGMDGDLAAVLEGLGRAWLLGVRVDWRAFHEHERLHRVALPPYPFERQRYWVDVQETADRRETLRPHKPTRQDDPASWFYMPSWRRTLPPRIQSGQSTGVRESVLLLDSGVGVLPAALGQRLRDAGHAVTLVSPGTRFERVDDSSYRVRLASEDDYAALFTELEQRDLSADRIVHCRTLEMPRAADVDAFSRGRACGLDDLTALVRAVAARPELARVEIIVASALSDGVEARDEVRPERAMLQALCCVVPQEYPALRCRVIDVGADDGAAGGERLAAEVLSGAAETVVAWRDGDRWARAFEPVRVETPPEDRGPWRRRGVYLITGGPGRVGTALAEHILRRTDATVVLLGRPAANDQAPTEHAQGTRLHLRYGDVADPDRLTAIVAEVRRTFGGLHGVVHAAGCLRPEGFAPLRRCDRAFEAQFRAKVYGLYALERSLADVGELEFCLLMSSLSSHLGGIEHAAYAAANRFMDAFASSRRAAGTARWISVASELWQFDDPATTFDATRPGLGASLAGLAMSAREATGAIDRVLTLRGVSEIATSTCDLNARFRQWTAGESVDPTPADPAASPVQARSASAAEYVAPRGEVEQRLAEIWAEVLGFETVGAEDDFFRLGGHSISAIRIVARLRVAIATEVSVADLLMHPTVARLGALIEERMGRAAQL